TDDQSPSGTVSFTPTIIGARQGDVILGEWSFNEIVLAYEAQNGSDSLSVDYLTSQAHYSTLMASAQTVSATDATYQLKENRGRLGISGSGSWIRPRVRMTAAQRMAVKGWLVKGFVVSDETVRVA